MTNLSSSGGFNESKLRVTTDRGNDNVSSLQGVDKSGLFVVGSD